MSGPHGRRRTAALAAAVLALAPTARAKVVFTGYGDFAATPQAWYRIDGPPSVLGQFGLGSEKIESRGSQINALGLFATTSLSDQARLQMDVTYRDIGQNAKTIRIQYAYLDWAPDYGDFQAGKITLPFGWYNQNRFYPFQRPSIDGPVFVSGILGLPQSDVGGDANKTVALGKWSLRGDLYAVNGYGPVPGSTSTFRSATLPGALTIAGNIGSRNANHKIAVGARAELAHAELKDSSAGVSYYRGEWDPGGQRLFQMAGAHLRASAGGWELLAEYLFLSVKGDDGMRVNFGSPDWRTDGFFAELDDRNPVAWGRKVTPWVRFEDYASRAYGGGPASERLWDLAGGASVQLAEAVALKLEASDLYYALPYAAGPLKLRGYALQAGLTVTF